MLPMPTDLRSRGRGGRDRCPMPRVRGRPGRARARGGREPLCTLDREAGAGGGLQPAFDRDRFLFRRKPMTLGGKYVVWDDEHRPILFNERPAHAGHQVLGARVTVTVFVVTFFLALVAGFALMDKVEPKWLGGAVLAILIVASIASTAVVLIKLTPKRHIEIYADESRDRPRGFAVAFPAA